VGGASKLERSTLNHFAFEVGSPDEVLAAVVAELDAANPRARLMNPEPAA